MRTAIILVSILFVPAVAFTDTIIVPDDYSTIQAAINASLNGDIILVSPGTYIENINFNQKSIIVKSNNGADDTVIDGYQMNSVVTFNSGEGLDSVLEGFTIMNGFAPTYGGGILFKYSSGTIINCTIMDNISNSGGGGIFCLKSNAFIKGNTIINNITNGGYFGGGGIGCYNYSYPTISNNIINNNTSKLQGGGICSNTGSCPIISDNIISDNIASEYGGGIYIVEYLEPITIIDNIIKNNKSDSSGGGIACLDTYKKYSLVILNNIINDNYANHGGGIFVGRPGFTGNSHFIIINNILYGNICDIGKGGGIYCSYASATTINNIITENTSANYGGGIGGTGCGIDICNSIVWDNSSKDDIEIIMTVGVLTISHSDVKNGKKSIYCDPPSILNWGLGNIDDGPLFVNPINDDYHLTYQSPCKDTGDNTVVTELFDFETDPRITNGTVDMGADEFHKHLYHTGDATPGDSVELNFIDAPGAQIQGLVIGFDVYDPPKLGAYGLWYITPPRLILTGLGPINSDGTFVLSGTLPNSPPGPYTLYFQAMIDWEMTNLSVMNVK